MTMFLPFAAVTLVRAEFSAAPGEVPSPTLVEASGHGDRASGPRTFDARELRELKRLPFPAGPDDLVVAFDGVGTAACFKALGLDPPHNFLDLGAEYRVATNGLAPREETALEDAARFLEIEHADARPPPLGEVLGKLCPRSPGTLGRALVRGRYAIELAAIQHRGIPVNRMRLAQLCEHWPYVHQQLTGRVDRSYGVHRNGRLDEGLFRKWLDREGISWPETADGRLDLDYEVFRDLSKTIPSLVPLKELRATVDIVDPRQLAVGPDRRHRFSFNPYWTITGRNGPGAKASLFGGAVWIRGLMQPPPGRAILHADWIAQEIGLVAFLSGDPVLIEDYLTGDCYAAFGRRVGLMRPGETKRSHPHKRALCKGALASIVYGVGPDTLSIKLGATVDEARRIIAQHRRICRRLWAWVEAVYDFAYAEGCVHTPLGWSLHVTAQTKTTSIPNLPLQGAGADVLRVAVIRAAEVGLEVVNLIHDAVVIECADNRIAEAREALEAAMARATADVLRGPALGVDVDVVRYPDRYCDQRGTAIWRMVFNDILKGKA